MTLYGSPVGVFEALFLCVIEQEVRNPVALSDRQNLAQLCLTFEEQKSAQAHVFCPQKVHAVCFFFSFFFIKFYCFICNVRFMEAYLSQSAVPKTSTKISLGNLFNT